MYSENLQIRPIEGSDCELLFKWANDKLVRSNAINKELISWEDHLQWFSKCISSDETKIFIMETNGFPVGQVRFDKDKEGFWIIDYSIDPAHRSKGYGNLLLTYGMNEFPLDERRFIGYVRSSNEASKKVFEKIGFKQSSLTIMEEDFYKFIYDERHKNF